MANEQEEKKVYTISEIAKELGVNKTTVSRAISGKGNLSAETRAKVLEFVEKHNYRPNAVAQSLANSRTYNLGLMLPGDAGVFDMSFFRDCLHGVCKAASKYGYDVLITMDDKHPLEQMIRLVDNRKVDGVIAMRSMVKSPIVRILKEKQVPFVLIGPTSDKEAVWVDNDNLSACRELTAYLIDRGMKKMVLLGGNETYCVTHSRMQGFREACEQAGLPWEDQQVYLNVRDGGRLSEAVDQAVSSQADCVLCMDDYICNLALSRLQNYGVRIPEDVSVVSFYDNVLLEHNIPPITSLHFDAVELGGIACRELLALLEGRKGGSCVLPEYQMILRGSTK